MELWFAFVLASLLILIIPGPTIILVLSQAVACGRRSALPLVAGVVLGDFTAMTASLLGLGAMMATSAALFGILKWLGAAYLVYLGVRLLMASPAECRLARAENPGRSSGSLVRSSYIVTALNPKSIAFFVAFLPQFIDPAKPMFSQCMLFGTTFLLLAGLNAAMYAMFAVQLKEHIRKEGVQRWFNRCGGSALIGAGVITASMKQAV